jgi:Methionyl-tRNA formyltransferase
MNIVLIGRGEILPAIGNQLLRDGHTITAIITAKESPEHRISARDLEGWAETVNALYIYAPSINAPEVISQIQLLTKDIGISVNYTSIIGQDVINMFPNGILNAHGGDLPRYKGNACQAWALINGEEKIGLCVHKMVGDNVDEGKIITRNYLNVDINTKIGRVYSWMEEQIPLLMTEAVKQLSNDPSYYIEDTLTQTERKPLRCYPRTPEDGRIDWAQDNTSILRLINASGYPFAGAFCYYEGEYIYISEAVIFDDEEEFLAVPGQILKLHTDGSVVVACGKGKLLVQQIKLNDNSISNVANIIKSVRKRLS